LVMAVMFCWDDLAGTTVSFPCLYLNFLQDPLTMRD
jgi:hypothetical protein